MKYTTYVLHSERYDRYYIGHTNNLTRRLEQHNTEKSKYTRHYHPWILVYKEEFNNRAEAMRREKYLKSLKNKQRLKEFIAGWRSSTLRGP